MNDLVSSVVHDLNSEMPKNKAPSRPKALPETPGAAKKIRVYADYFLGNGGLSPNTVPVKPKQNPDPPQQNQDYVPDPEKEKVKPHDLAKYLEVRFTFGVRKSAKHGEASYLYLYQAKHGGFGHLLPGEFDAMVRAMENLPGEFYDAINMRFLTEAYRWLCSSRKTKKLPTEVPSDRINVKNGTLFLNKKTRSIKLKPHDQKNRLFNSIKASWVPCTEEQWRKTRTYRFLKRFSCPQYGEAGVCFLVYMLGKIFTNIRTGKSIYYIYGPTDVGKGRLCQLIVFILGAENCSELALKTFTERFGPIALLDKMLNISYDENTETWTKRMAADLKTISAHDPMRADIKNRDPISFTPNAVLLCFGNEKPIYSADVDAGGAVSNRLNCFRTGASVPKEEQEPDLAEQMEREKDLVFSYCVRYFIEHDEPEKLEKDASGQKIGFANITAKQGFKLWASEQVAPVKDANMGSEDFYGSYLAYLNENGITEALKLKPFQMEFAKHYKNFKGPRENNKVRYKGLGIVAANAGGQETDTDGSLT